MSEYLALAERVEAATGPDRGLDAEISSAVSDGCNIRWHHLAFFWFASGKSPPAYTASLDAAITLVPEGWVWTINTFGSPAKAHAYLMNDQNAQIRCNGYPASPALALVAAALRSRAAAGLIPTSNDGEPA